MLREPLKDKQKPSAAVSTDEAVNEIDEICAHYRPLLAACDEEHVIQHIKAGQYCLEAKMKIRKAGGKWEEHAAKLLTFKIRKAQMLMRIAKCKPIVAASKTQALAFLPRSLTACHELTRISPDDKLRKLIAKGCICILDSVRGVIHPDMKVPEVKALHEYVDFGKDRELIIELARRWEKKSASDILKGISDFSDDNPLWMTEVRNLKTLRSLFPEVIDGVLKKESMLAKSPSSEAE